MNIAEQFKNIFEPELIQELEQKGKYLFVKEGDVILHIGETVRLIPIVISGTIKVSRLDNKGHELLLYYVTPKESCAMTFTCCMQHFPSEIRATAEDDTEILAIPIAAMDEWMIKYSTWKSFVMKTIHTRFNELLTTIDQLAFQKLDERLIHYLKEKSKATGSSLINLSHEQIANDLASTREVISRLLKRLENENKLLLYRNQIKILSSL
jgi:CRP/FNR family transcriptional regulator